MTGKDLIEIGKWLNKQGYDLNLKDSFWMEDYIEDHKIRDLAKLLVEYGREQLSLHNVIQRSEQFYCWESGEVGSPYPICSEQCDDCKKQQ